MGRDEILAQEHENYIKIVNESGMPKWMYDMYTNHILREYDNYLKQEQDEEHT